MDHDNNLFPRSAFPFQGLLVFGVGGRLSQSFLPFESMLQVSCVWVIDVAVQFWLHVGTANLMVLQHVQHVYTVSIDLRLVLLAKGRPQQIQ